MEASKEGVEVKVFFPETFQSQRLAFLRFLELQS